MTTALASRAGRAAAAIGVAALLMIAMATPAQAHDFESSYLYVDVADSALGGRVELPYQDMRDVLGLELGVSADAVLAELETNLPRLHAYLQEHVAVGAAGNEWELNFEGVEVLRHVLPASGSGYAIFPYTAEVPGTTVPQELDFRFDPFFDEIGDRSSLVLLGNDWKRGVFDEEANRLLVLDPSNRAGSVDLGEAGQWKNFTGSIDLGVEHIRTGADHIMFIFVLLLASVLVLAGTWRPAPSFQAGLWRVIKVASMFTIAHSITFTLAGLDVLPLPPSTFTEVVIALSIAAAALHNLRPILHEREWIIAFAFGLFHGMGFASLVDSLDVGRTTQLISLLGRNVGIEIAQVVLILIVFPSLFLLRRTVYYMPIFRIGSLGLVAVSGLWVYERLFSLNLRPTVWINRLIEWPRSAYVMVIVTVAALALYAVERLRGRLLPLETSPRPRTRFLPSRAPEPAEAFTD